MDATSALLQQVVAQPTFKPVSMLSKPGVMRDGTRLMRDNYSEVEWTRFWQDRPRKMLGYSEQVRSVDGVARAINVFTNGGFVYVHLGTAQQLQRYTIDISTGTYTNAVVRTPAAYSASDLTLWSMDTIWQTTTSAIFAAPMQSLTDISDFTDVQVYTGDVIDAAALTPALATGSGDPIETSGGVVAVGPYLFLYGHDGFISWNAPANPLDRSSAGSGTARPVADKIVKGMPLRGSAAPAALFWSLSSLIVANFSSGTPSWTFSTVTTNGSILGQNSVVEHNGVYYWATTSGFSRFAGVMEDLPNEYNQQWFLSNLNYSQRQKVFAYKVPRFREIWWCFPKGTSTEPNHAIIYNYDKGFWFDTPLPNGGRGCGIYDDIYSYPIMAGVTVNGDTGGTSTWQHEIGVNEVSGAPKTSKAVRASFETHEFSLLNTGIGESGENRQLSFSVLEQDFNQVGDLTLEIFSRNNAAQQTYESPVDDNYPYVIQETPSDEMNQNTDIKWSGRLTAFKVTSNTRDGYFEAGAPLVHTAPGNARRIG
jgi:hypothetical protein